MAEAGPPPARFPPARLPPAGSSRAGLPPTGSPPASTPALASQWLAVKRLPRAAAKAPNLQLNQDHCSFVPFTQAVPVQVDMAMALHRVRIAEKYGKNYLCLLQAVFLAETGLLLQLKDINHFLMQDIAFLSGGRGKDNAWIITFPENCNFRCIPEEVIAKVLNYLTSIARQSGSDSRFTIILDRRLDTWASLKISLQKISASFPGSLHLVLVLRPTSFLQRTFTDIGFRFSQEDFMLKLPAIEKFAVTVKEMAQMLQSFGTELAETELPQDILSIEEILAGRAERYHLLKELLTKARIVILRGHKLASNHHYALDLICQRCNELRYLSDILVNEIRTKRVQLSRTFKVHRLLQQARQCCDQGECLLASQGMDKFQTKEDAQKALQDVDNFLQMAMPFINYDIESLQYEFDVLLSPELKAQMQNIQLKLENIRSAFQNQQAGCKSLKEVPEGAFQNLVPASENVMRSRMIFFSPKHVKKSWRQIHAQSNVKVEAVEDSQEKNSDQSPKLDNSLDILKNHVLNELIQTERAYVRELFTVLLGYRSEMDNPQMFDLMPPLLRNKKDVLFGNMAEIYEFHNNIFMSRLEDCSACLLLSPCGKKKNTPQRNFSPNDGISAPPPQVNIFKHAQNQRHILLSFTFYSLNCIRV